MASTRTSYRLLSIVSTPISASRWSSSASAASATGSVDVKKTVLLPKTSFPPHVKPTERAGLDELLARTGDFEGLYAWQWTAPDRQELPIYNLLDGPPYANGNVHVGHAINKILKDFIFKTKLSTHRVRFQPGWDCHGLPIELKIAKSKLQASLSPLETREAARAVATAAIDCQRYAFKRWGVTADWDAPYRTMDASYVAQQLRIFADLFGKGFVYRAFKPVYWSPSSKSALAESELEYNDKHASTAAFFRFQFINLNADKLGLTAVAQESSKPLHLFALVWTTTPWTLPLNDVIAFSPKLRYAVVEFEDNKSPVREMYLIAQNLVPQVTATINRPLKVHAVVDGSALEGAFYRHCWYNNIASPLVEAGHVSDTIGTGLVHSCYAHGFDDYKIALSRDEDVECFVDEEGRYTRQMGYDLEGKEVLYAGSKTALELLRKNVVHTHRYVHSYPYDWRTKKPVIIRASRQWFVDVSKVGEQAANLVRTSIEMEPGQRAALVAQLTNRPAWCISRQRVWGVPIPALVDADTEQAFISPQLIHRVAEGIENAGTSDWWWRASTEELLAGKEVSSSLKLPSTTGTGNLKKGNDVMDVWMDSGLAWHTLEGDQVADVVVEGVDQFRGWFQSLLLTSVAARATLPYRRVVVHGFAIDDKGRKMSKSIGNVLDPFSVTDGNLKQKPLGADGLRLWVAMYGSEGANDVKIGRQVLDELEGKLKLIRNSLKFQLGNLGSKFDGESPKKLRLIDKFIISRVRAFADRSQANLSDLRFRVFMNEFIQFLSNPLSSVYLHCVRDRLYCDPVDSDDRKSALFTISHAGERLALLLAPLLPHLATEFFMHHPTLSEHAGKCLQPGAWPINVAAEAILNDVSEADVALVEKLIALRARICNEAGKQDASKEGVVLSPASAAEYENLLAANSNSPESFNSDLTEILSVSFIRVDPPPIEEGPQEMKASLIPSPGSFCSRCRRHSRASSEAVLCSRCDEAVRVWKEHAD